MKKFLIAAFAVALIAVWVVPSMAVDLSGQVMIRGEYDKNVGFHDDVAAERGADGLWRTTLSATANPTDSTTVEVSIQGSGIWGDADDALRLHEAYVQEDNLFGSDVSLRIGRQVLSYDDQRIIGALNWSKTPNRDDALKVMYNSDEFDVEAFAAKQAECALAEPCDDMDLYGVHATVKTIPDNTISVYTFIEHSGSATRYTLGARVKGKMSAVDYTFELPFQTGQVTDTMDISAYAIGARAGYNLPGPNKIRIGGEFDYATGDDPLTADELEGFGVIQPTGHAHLGSMDEHVWSDLLAYSVNASAMATPELKVIGAYWKFTDLETPVGIDDDLGSEIDLTAVYKYNSALTIKGGYSMYLPGAQQEDFDGTATETRHWGWLMAVSNF